MARRRRRELIEADQFHVIVVSLLRTAHADWNEWEEDWLMDQAQRPADYEYTDNQWRTLKQLIIYAKSYTTYAGRSVEQLRRIALRYRLDLDLDGQEFVDTLERRHGTALKHRQIRRLAAICRLSEDIPSDEQLDAPLHLSDIDHALILRAGSGL